MAKILITSALPYINGVKHLGNLAGSLLPADVHARFRRQIGDEVLFICATDEHGTPAELAALEAGLPVAEYCARQHALQADIYRRFSFSFDHFGRSSSPQNHELTQHFFLKLDQNGLIEERVLRQVYSAVDGRFLPDRYVIGTCPYCGYAAARGDQCEECTRLLDPADLVAPRSALSGSPDLELRDTRHLFLRQSAMADILRAWIDRQIGWPPLVISIARKWLDEGLRDRCITRDLAWGVPVPRSEFEDKVFYVWFDAPIAYIASTKEWADLDPTRRDWRSWWSGAEDVRYLQFLGKDNVPFHTISFPCTLLGSSEPWKTADVIKGFNWLTYEGGKFSTSQKRGIFSDEALEELPADVWRWWLTANAPESADSDLALDRFAADVNKDLADTLGNLVHRILRFVESHFGGAVPAGCDPGIREAALATEVERRLATLRAAHEALRFRKAAAEARGIWAMANRYVADAAPWTVIHTAPARAALAARIGVNLLNLVALVAWPFIPDAASRVLSCLGENSGTPRWPDQPAADALCRIPPGRAVQTPDVLFAKLTTADVARLKARFHTRGQASP